MDLRMDVGIGVDALTRMDMVTLTITIARSALTESHFAYTNGNSTENYTFAIPAIIDYASIHTIYF